MARNAVKIFIDTEGGSVEFDRTRIRKASVATRNTSDNGQPHYGVACGYGKIELIDTDGEILRMVEAGQLTDGLPVRMYFNPPERNADEATADYEERIRSCMVGNLKTEQFNYAYGGAAVSVDLQDALLEWDNAAFLDTEQVVANNSALIFYDRLQSQTSETVNITGRDDRPLTGMAAYLVGIRTPDGFILQTSLREAWELFCSATLTRIHRNRYGEIWLTR